MRVTFLRPVDHQLGHALIERDDGVRYRMRGGPVTAELPHDLVHYTVEDTLGMADGIWGAIAGGVVFHSMTHVSGRRPPHAAERSAELIRRYRDRLQAAETIGGFVAAMARQPDADLGRYARETFGSWPAGLPNPPGIEAVSRAIAALRQAQERWQTVPVGAQLTMAWPAHRRMVGPPVQHHREKAAARRHH